MVTHFQIDNYLPAIAAMYNMYFLKPSYNFKISVCNGHNETCDEPVSLNKWYNLKLLTKK